MLNIDLKNNELENVYLTEALLNSQTTFNNIMETLMNEEEFMEVSLEADMVGGNKTTVGSKLKTGLYNKTIGSIKVVDLMISFFSKMYDMLLDFINKYGRMNDLFLRKVKMNLNEANYAKLTITLDDKYLKSENLVRQIRNSEFFRRVTNPNLLSDQTVQRLLQQEKDGVVSMQDFLNSDICKQFLSEDGSLANGTKNFFRYGEAKHMQRKIAISGEQLGQACTQMYNFCDNYKTMGQELKAISAVATRAVKMMEQKLNQKNPTYGQQEQATTESVLNCFSLLENCFFDETELRLCKDFPLLEADMRAEQQAQPNNRQVNNNNAQNGSAPPNVSTGQAIKQQKQADIKNVEMTRDAAISKTQVQMLRYIAQALQIYVSGAMTIAQERYLTYMRVLTYCFKGDSKKASVKGAKKGDMVSDEKNAEFETNKKK